MRRLLTCLLLGCASLIHTAAPASAQSAEPTDGAADFRTAPTIGDGTYSVEVVTGETVWFSVLYENNTFPVRIVPTVVDPSPGVTASAVLVFPNLRVVVEEPQYVQEGGRLTYGSGTNTWYVGIRLSSEDGARGIRHDVEFELEGFLASDTSPCDPPSCTLEDDLADVEAEIERLQAAIDEGGPVDEDQQARVDELEGELAAVDTDIRELCDGTRCTEISTTTTTPWAIVAVLVVVALALGGFALRSRPAPTADEPVDS